MLTNTTTIDSFQKLVDEEKTSFFMKHNSTCPISAAVLEECQKFHYGRDMDGDYLVVQDHRQLSDHISDTFGITHESPQAFYFVDGEPKWNDSHQKITLNTLASVED